MDVIMSELNKKVVTVNGKPRTIYKRAKTNTWYYVMNGKRIDYVEAERNHVYATDEHIISTPVVAPTIVKPVDNSYLHKYYSRIYASYKRTPFIPKRPVNVDDYHYVADPAFDSHKNTADQVLALLHRQRMRVLRYVENNNL